MDMYRMSPEEEEELYGMAGGYGIPPSYDAGEVEVTGAPAGVDLMAMMGEPTSVDGDYRAALEMMRQRQSELENSVQSAYARETPGPSKQELLFRLSQAFLTPGQTGNFTEGLAAAGGVGAQYAAEKRKAAVDNLNAQRTGAVELSKLRLDAQKQELSALGERDKQERLDRRAMLMRYASSGKSKTDGEKYAAALGLQPGTEKYNAFIKDYIKRDLQGKALTFGAPISAVRDSDNKPVLVRAEPGGSGVVEVPGYTPAPYDVGTKRDLSEASAEGGALGKEEGLAEAQLRAMESNMPQLETTVDKLRGLSEKATYTATGKGVDFVRRQLDMDPREAAVARVEFQNTIKNVLLPTLSDTFPGAITEGEREALLTTLGDADLSPAEKIAAIDTFIEQKRLSLESKRRRTGRSPQPAAPVGNAASDQQPVARRRRWNPQAEAFEEVQ